VDQDDVASAKDEQDSVELLSPVASKAKQGVFELVPKFSFESTESDDKSLKEDIEHTQDDRLAKVETKLGKLKEKLTRPFMDIEASYAVIVDDISKLHDRVKSMGNYLGVLPSQFKTTDSSLSKLIGSTMSKVSDLEQFHDRIIPWLTKLQSSSDALQPMVEEMQDELAELQALPSQVDSWMLDTHKTMELFNKRLLSLKSIISRPTSSLPVGKENVIPGIDNQHSSAALYRRILDMEEKIKILENRVVGAGVQLGSLVFQSFEDLVAWVKVEVPKGQFGLFVDGHSFLEFFSLSGHIDTEAGAAAFSHSQKAGFSTYIEAQLAISFKNLFPMVFGKGGSASLDDSACLPAISNGDKWNNGSTGIHHQLMRNMNDVSYQLDDPSRKFSRIIMQPVS
jgi:hypothetical protein